MNKLNPNCNKNDCNIELKADKGNTMMGRSYFYDNLGNCRYTRDDNTYVKKFYCHTCQLSFFSSVKVSTGQNFLPDNRSWTKETLVKDIDNE